MNIIIFLVLSSVFAFANEIVPKTETATEEEYPAARESLRRCETGDKHMCYRALAQARYEGKNEMFIEYFDIICETQEKLFSCSVIDIDRPLKEFGDLHMKDRPKRGMDFLYYDGEPKKAYIIDAK